MAVTLTTAARNAACNAIVDLVDAGAGDSTLVLYLANASTEVATLTFAATAFGNAATGVATAAAIASDTSATGNAAAAEVAIFKTGTAGTEVLRCSVLPIPGRRRQPAAGGGLDVAQRAQVVQRPRHRLLATPDRAHDLGSAVPALRVLAQVLQDDAADAAGLDRAPWPRVGRFAQRRGGHGHG
jgi:hypothetical protein